MSLWYTGKITNLGYSESIEEINKFESIEDQDKLVYLNFEIDRLKYEINERIIPFMNKSIVNERENMMNNLINDNFMIREDMNVQRMMINSLRKQLQFLLYIHILSYHEIIIDQIIHHIFSFINY